MSQKHIDANNSYMDGVRVKISERYKPPPKIMLAMTYAQRLTLNRQLQDNMPTYNFDIDGCVKEKMKEWRLARRAMATERKEKLEKLREAEALKAATAAVEVEPAADSNKTQTIKEVCSSEKLGAMMLIPTQANILTPIPLVPQQRYAPNAADDASPINISDFEPDTSSPFDNLELKSLNDLEELKMVLQQSEHNRQHHHPHHQPLSNQTYAPSQNSNSYYNYASMPAAASNTQVFSSVYASTTTTSPAPAAVSTYFGTTSLAASPPTAYSYGHYHNGQNDVTTYLPTVNGFDSSSSTSDQRTAYNSVPHIIKSLQNRLNLNEPSPQQPPPPPSPSPSTAKASSHDDLENPYSSLPKAAQTVCDGIATMGFPLARVARACQTLGDDEKKIVDYLLALAQLMDLGFNEEKVAAALRQSEMDRDKALELLIA